MRQMHISFLFLLRMKLVVRALKFEYMMETNKTGTVVFLVSFQIYFVYQHLLHIVLSDDGWRQMHSTFISLLDASFFQHGVALYIGNSTVHKIAKTRTDVLLSIEESAQTKDSLPTLNPPGFPIIIQWGILVGSMLEGNLSSRCFP